LASRGTSDERNLAGVFLSTRHDAPVRRRDRYGALAQ